MDLSHTNSQPLQKEVSMSIFFGLDRPQQQEEKKNAFDVLPNELLFQILTHHLPPLWHVICQSVCQQWRLILLNSKAQPTSLFSTKHAHEGHLNVLQWARSQGCPWDEWTCAYAAQGGHLEVLKWLRAQGCPWNKWTCTKAAHGGHLEVLQWAHSQGCPWNEYTYYYASLRGHLEVLQWAHSQGCPWDEDTCAKAAAGGHLEVLQWATSQGCPWNGQISVLAIKTIQKC